MTTMKKHFAAVAFAVLAAAGTAHAGRGGSLGKIQAAVTSGSVDAIIAEIERAEYLPCDACADIMTSLLDHPRYEVRQAAGWWFAKRPTVKDMMIGQMTGDLGSSNPIAVRNAADFLGTVKAYGTLPQLASTFAASGNADVRFAIIRAAGRMAARSGNTLLVAGMSDADARIRVEAINRYRDVLRQTDATPLYAHLGDSEARVRASAATAIGGLKGAAARVTLETMVVSDADPAVRRNAAWALGQIGDRASRTVLEQAQRDSSGLVRRTATAAIALLR